MIELLREHFKHNPDTGELYRKKSHHKRYIGWTNGSPNGRGYRLVRIGKTKYPVHRVMWILEHGYIPDEIDHINHDKSDNRLSNLREVSRQEQMKNRSANKNNKSGHIGVSIYGDQWRAHIGIDGKRVYLGVFNSREEAIIARLAAEKVYKFHPNHGDKNV